MQKSPGWGQRIQLAYGKKSLENIAIVSQGHLNKILLEVWMVEKCKKYCAEVRAREMSPTRSIQTAWKCLCRPTVGWDEAALLSSCQTLTLRSSMHRLWSQ